MMIGHISDTHLGALANTEREQDYYEAFNEAVDLFIRERVDLVIHSGDILDVPRPYGTAMRALVEGVKRLRDRGIRLLFTLGEHDIGNIPSTPHPITLSLTDLATYIGDGEPHEVGSLLVIGLHNYKQVDRDALLERLRSIGETTQNRGGKKIIVLHQGLKEKMRHGWHLSAYELPEGFDYYALGHSHSWFYESIGGRHIGCPGVTHWLKADEPDDAGALLIDMSGGEPLVQRARLESVRPKYRLSLNIEELEQALRNLTQEGFRKKPCLWLEITTSRPYEASTLERSLSERFIIQGIRVVRSGSLHRILGERQELNLDEELLRLSRQVVGDESLAELAIKELLPHLSSGNVKEALALVMRMYREEAQRDREGKTG